jgi:hypothetical protein
MFSGLKSGNLAESPQVSFRLAELGRDKRLHQIPRDRGANGSAPHAKDIHVVIFDTLPGGKVVVNQGGSDARNFIGADCGANAASANGKPAFHLTSHHGFCQRSDKIGVVVIGT